MTVSVEERRRAEEQAYWLDMYQRARWARYLVAGVILSAVAAAGFAGWIVYRLVECL